MSETTELGQDRKVTEWLQMLKREEWFLKHKLDSSEAFLLAVRVMYRDRPGSGDDRRLCIECGNAALKAGKCNKGMAFIPFTLQRCDNFARKSNDPR